MKPHWLMTVLCLTMFTDKACSLSPPPLDQYLVATGRRLKRTTFNTDDDTEDPVKMTAMHISSEIALRYARTTVISHILNPSNRPQEVTFRMLLPDTAFISGFAMNIDGIIYKAFVKEKEDAQEIYNEAVSQGIGAGHVATNARDSNHFTVTVNVEGNSTAVFHLKYEEFLVRRHGVYNHAINLHPGALLPKMEVVVHIKESKKITKLRVPEMRTGKEVDATAKDAQNSYARITRKRNKQREATVTFTPNLEEQKRLAEIYAHKIKERSSTEKFIGYNSDEEEGEDDGKVLGQFVVQYDVERSNTGEILVNDGYFVHFLAPSALTPLSKHVVFVLDTSISMLDNKIEQLRNAMDAILSDLHPNDYFNLVEFNSEIIVHDLKEADDEPTWRQEYYRFISSTSTMVSPALASPENVAKGKVIVSRLEASGATNIYDALDVALNLVKNGIQNSTTNNTNSVKRVVEPVIIFLTDGAPTIGEASTSRITSFVTGKNTGDRRAPIYTLAFGEDAERSFLRKLSLLNEGFMRHIYEASDAALQLHDFYRQVSSPLLSNVQFQYPSKQIKEGSLSRNQFRTINEGSEVAVVGQLAEGISEMTPRIRGLHATENGYGRVPYASAPKVSVNSTKDEHLPLERLWAYITIKQLLDKDETDDDGSGDEHSPKKKALSIALKYAFVTPLTSLVVVKPTESRPPRTESDSVQGEGSSESEVHPPIRGPSTMSADFQAMPRSGRGYSFLPNPASAAVGANVHYTVVPDGVMKTVAVISSSNRRRNYNRGSDISGTLGRRNHYDGGFPGPIGQHFDNPSNYGGGLPGPIDHYYRPTEKGEDPDRFAFQGTFTIRPPTSNEARTVSNDNNYNIGDFQLARYLQRHDSLLFTDNGVRIVLKLTNDMNVTNGCTGCLANVACSNSTIIPETVAGKDDSTGSLCVYLTRCSGARNMTADDYVKSYCIINNRYAGVCCPISEIDKPS